MPRIRVLIADDHGVLRSGLKLLIGGQSDMEVVGEAADGPATVRSAQATAPDVVLLDISMPGPRASRTIEQLGRLDPSPRVLVLTMHDDPAYLRVALLAGVSGYVVKKAADVELLTAIRVVHRGGTFAALTRPGGGAQGEDAIRATRAEPAAKRRALLSPREAEVLRLLAQGHTNQEVADKLAVSLKTIETHRERLRNKLSLKSRAQLFRFAVESGLLERDTALPSDE
jgi:two-component system, NarL family, response regulator NreC